MMDRYKAAIKERKAPWAARKITDHGLLKRAETSIKFF